MDNSKMNQSNNAGNRSSSNQKGIQSPSKINDESRKAYQLSNQLQKVKKRSLLRKDGESGQITIQQASKIQMRRPKYDFNETGSYNNEQMSTENAQVHAKFERFLRISKSSSATTDQFANADINMSDRPLSNIQSQANKNQMQKSKSFDMQNEWRNMNEIEPINPKNAQYVHQLNENNKYPIEVFTAIIDQLINPADPLQNNEKGNIINRTIEENRFKDNKIIIEGGFKERLDTKQNANINTYDSIDSKNMTIQQASKQTQNQIDKVNQSNEQSLISTPQNLEGLLSRFSETTLNRENTSIYMNQRKGHKFLSSQQAQTTQSHDSAVIDKKRVSLTPKPDEQKIHNQSQFKQNQVIGVDMESQTDPYRAGQHSRSLHTNSSNMMKSNQFLIHKVQQQEAANSDDIQILNHQNKQEVVVKSEVSEDAFEKQQLMQALQILEKPSLKRNESDIQYMVGLLNQFDFVKRDIAQKAKKQQEEKAKMYQKNIAGNDIQQEEESEYSETDEEDKKHSDMTKDQASMEQVCKVMKPVMVPKHMTVFEYDSEGDLFYMVLKGEVDCKIKMSRQLILLSDAEKDMYIQEFQDDILRISLATRVNNVLVESDHGSSAGGSQNNQEIEKLIKNHNVMRNPYLLPKHKLYKYIENLIDNKRLILESKISQIASDKKDSISRRKQSNLSPLSKKFSSSGIGNFKQSIDGQLSSIHDLTQNRFSKITTPMANFHDQVSAGLNQNQESRGKITPRKTGEDQNQGASSVLDENIVKLEQDFQDLINISQTLLEQVEQSHYHDEPVKRKYYQLSILKKVLTYKPFESFGELALIQNKRRAAKLQVTGKSDAYFAVLSKKDYKQAHHKAQNEILQSNIAFLRKFIIFQNLSDHALSGLTYIMKEVKCQRGQKIYREGLDIANKIYLVKQGEFISFKKIEVDNMNTNQHLNDIGHFVKNELKNEKSDDVEFNATHHVQKFKLQQTNQKNLVKPHKQVQQIEICIHGQFDIFGFQELLAESTQPMRSQSVQCLQPNSIMVSIDKADLNIHIRRNPAIFEMLIKNWVKLINKRLNQTANKGHMSILKEQKQLSKSTDIDHNQSIRELIEEKKNKEQKMKETVSNDNWSNSPQSIKIRKESKDVSLHDSIVIDQQQIDQVKSNQINLKVNSKQDEIVTQSNSEFKFHNQHSQNSHKKQSVLPKIEPNFNFDSKNPVNIINQNKKELDVNYSDFRQSIQGSVSPKEYNRVRKMESYIQNILRKKQNIKDNKNYDLAGVKVSGSVQNQQVVLKSQNLNKSIRMQQSVFQFQQQRPSTIQSHYSSQMAVSQINNENQVAKSTFQLPSLKSQETFEKSLNVELLNNSKLNETSLDNLNQFEKQLKKYDKMNTKRQTAHNISLIKSQSSNNLQLNNLNSISNLNAYHLNTSIQFNTALSSTKNHNIPQKASNQQSLNVKSIKGNSISHTFTKDASDWNKESAIVQDQVSKFLFKNNRQNTTERLQTSNQKLQFNQHLQMSQNESKIDGFISQDLSAEKVAQQTLTQASIPNYSEMAIDQGDATIQQQKINNHQIIQRKIQQSAIKDYSFEQDIKQLIQTKKNQDKSLSNLMVSSPRSQRNDAHLGNLKLEAQLSQHNKSQLEIKQQISRDAQKVLLNPLLIKENTQQRYGTSGLKHRNYNENYDVRQDLIPNSKSLTAAQTSSVLQRKVLNVYKRFAHSKQDIFVANVARASIDQDSLTVPQTHQIQDLNKHYNSVSNFNKFEPKSILLRYRQYNSKLDKVNKTSNPLNDTHAQSTQAIPQKKSKKQDIRQKSETREINKNNQLSLPKIIMRQIVYEKDDLNQNTLVEHDHMRKLYLEQLTEGTSAHNKWSNKEPNKFAQPIRNRNLNNNKQSSNSKKINKQQISSVDKDMINEKSVSKISESSLQTSEEQLPSSQQQDTSQNQKDSSYKDVILKKQLRDTNKEQKSLTKKKKKKKPLKHIKTIEFGKKSYSVESEDNSRKNRNQGQSNATGQKNVQNQYKDYTSDMGNQDDKIQRKPKNRSQQPKDIQKSQQQLHENQRISDTKQAKIDLNNVSRQIKDKNINQIGMISNMSETPYQTDEHDYPYNQDSQKEIQNSVIDHHQEDHEPYTDDDHDSQIKEDREKQNNGNEDQSVNDDEKTFDVKGDDEFGNQIIPEVSIKNELQDDQDNQQSNLMKESQKGDQTSSNNKSMPPAYVIMKKRTKKHAGRSQESRNSKYSHDPSSKSKRTISNNTNDKMNVTADGQRFKDITKNLIGNVDGSSIQPNNSLSPIGSKRLQKGFAGFTGNTTMRLNDELLQEDYVLPEYRQNARRLTKEEVDALHQYNKQNLKKFNEEMTGGIKIENKFSRNYNSTKQT